MPAVGEGALAREMAFMGRFGITESVLGLGSRVCLAGATPGAINYGLRAAATKLRVATFERTEDGDIALKVDAEQLARMARAARISDSDEDRVQAVCGFIRFKLGETTLSPEEVEGLQRNVRLWVEASGRGETVDVANLQPINNKIAMLVLKCFAALQVRYYLNLDGYLPAERKWLNCDVTFWDSRDVRESKRARASESGGESPEEEEEVEEEDGSLKTVPGEYYMPCTICRAAWRWVLWRTTSASR
mmetsp:Transcript_2502/g.6823  ORF Transcript_2502/g.6823 Transcript_2502/m.6823 type:complete len:247 (+) Transcript_2502:136-876(+)